MESVLHMERTAGSGSPKKRTHRELLEQGVHLIFFLCGLLAVAAVLGISLYLIFSGLPAIREIGLKAFLLGDTWASSQGVFGILPFILSSLAGTAGAVILGVPVGVLTAVFLAKTAPAKVAGVIRSAVSLLAGIPSVVYGLVGMVVLVPAVQRTFGLASGASLLAAIVVLAIMILPSIISVSETALRAVPKEYEEASLALGATEMETYFRVSLPAARSGVATAVVLGVGRAIGEAMASMPVSSRPPLAKRWKRPATRLTSMLRTTHWSPYFFAAAPIRLGSAMAPELTLTLSAPHLSTRSKSSSVRMPPPTVRGMNTWEATWRRMSVNRARPSAEAVMS